VDFYNYHFYHHYYNLFMAVIMADDKVSHGTTLGTDPLPDWYGIGTKGHPKGLPVIQAFLHIITV